MRTIAHHSEDSRTDLGVLFALAVLLVAFETLPGMTVSPLAVRTSSDDMEGVDAPVEYLVPDIEEPDEIPVDLSAILDDEVPDLTTQIINLTGDSTGLEVVGTVETNIDENTGPSGDPDAIPEPGTFIPHSVPPRCTFRPTAEYPAIARQAGVEGRVTLQLFVPVSGLPSQVVVVQSSGLSSMDSAAVASAWLTRWAPAERDDGHPVGVWTALIYDFKLE